MNRTLLSLSLGNNKIGDAGAQKFGEVKHIYGILFTMVTVQYVVTCQAHPALVKKENQMCGSFLFKNFV